jgi:hypothetical protein
MSERAREALASEQMMKATFNNNQGAPKIRKAATKSRQSLNKKLKKEYYLLFTAIGNSNLSVNQINRLIPAARAFRLSRPSQLAAWSGSFLEDPAFKRGAELKGTTYIDKATNPTDPLELVQVSKPTMFIKTAFPINPTNSGINLKTKMAQNARVAMNSQATRIRNNMLAILKFTEKMAEPRANNNNNENIKGKVKGTTEIQPDIILSIPAPGGGGEIHIYELKIGLGKKETIPAESFQLAKIKYLIDTSLRLAGIRGWKVYVHFLPWLFGSEANLTPGSVPSELMNFKNWAKSNNPTYKKWANNFIASNKAYNIIKTARTNKPLANHINIPSINSLLTVSRAGNIGAAGRGARTIAASGMATAVRKSNNVAKFLSAIKAVINDPKVKPGTFTSISAIARYLDGNLMKTAQQYFTGLPENTPGLSPNLARKIGSITPNGRFTPRGGSGYNTNNSDFKNTVEDRRQALNKALKVSEAFYKGLSNARLNTNVPQAAFYKNHMAKIREVFVDTAEEPNKTAIILRQVNANISAGRDPFTAISRLVGAGYSRNNINNALKTNTIKYQNLLMVPRRR